MKTAELFHACEKRKRAILKNGPAWLARYRKMVTSWGGDLSVDATCLAAAIEDDVAKVSMLRQSTAGNSGPSIGFLSSAYLPVGGTETFHRMLLPRLKQVANILGFVAIGYTGGDGALLGVPYATGTDAAVELAGKCDIIVTWGIDSLWQILPTARPKVIGVHHADPSSGWSNNIILNQSEFIDELVCVSIHSAKFFREWGKPVHYIPNALDPSRIPPSEHVGNLRAQHNIPPGDQIVLFGHRLSIEKRPELAVEVARCLPDGWTMVIVGEGDHRGRTEAIAADLRQVRIVGRSDSLADWLSISDCFLSLSICEGFGFSVGEAMLAGVPTVSTPVGIAPGLAITLPTDSLPEAWAEAILNSHEWVPPADLQETFSASKMVARWAAVLADVPTVSTPTGIAPGHAITLPSFSSAAQ